MENYEITCLINPNLSEEELNSCLNKLNETILEQGGKIEKSKEVFKQRLGYSIKEKEEAFLSSIKFSLNAEKLEELDKKIKIEKEVLRFMITKKSPIKLKAIETKKPVLSQPTVKKTQLKEIDKKIEEILNE